MDGRLLGMTTLRAIGLAVGIGLAAAILAQPLAAQQEMQALEKALVGKEKELLNYSADPVARYTWAGDKLAAQPVKLHTLCGFTTHSIKLAKGKIVLEGTRATLIRYWENRRVAGSAGGAPMTLEVDLRGADSAAVLPKLQEMLFFPNPKAAIDGLPMPAGAWQLVELPESEGTALSSCHSCLTFFDEGHKIEVPSSDPKFTVPKITSKDEAKFSDEARKAKVSGSVVIQLYVSEIGKVGEMWLRKPLGFGLDERAADAVRNYLFKPAQYDGRPVGFVLNVQVEFKAF